MWLEAGKWWGFASAPILMAETQVLVFFFYVLSSCLSPSCIICLCNIIHFKERDGDPGIGHPQSLLVLLEVSVGPSAVHSCDSKH